MQSPNVSLPRLYSSTEASHLRQASVLPALLVVALIATLASPLQAEIWPGFRGPTQQGHSTEKKLPLHWSAESNVVWKTEIPAPGWSSPIVWGNRVFVTGVSDNNTKCRVLALDSDSGKILWDKTVFEQVPRRKESKNSYATPTPVTDGRNVYAVFGDGSVVALTVGGEILWTNREVQFYSRHGLGASPVLHDGLLIMPFDGSNPIAAAGAWPKVSDEEKLGWQIPWDKAFIAALDAKTGKRVWTAKRGMSRIAHVSPIVAKVDGKEVLISGAGDRMQGFNLKNGELLWSVYAQGEGVTPSPVVGEGLLFTSSGFEKTTLRAIKLAKAKGDVTESHIAWEQKKGVPTQPSPIYVKPYLYAITDGGIATCYKPETGDIVWQERIGGNHSASPIHANGKIYFLSEGGETTVIAAGPEFKILAKNPLGEKCQASLAPSGGRLFIRTEKNLFCISAK